MFAGFQNVGFQHNAFQLLFNPVAPIWGSRGGLGEEKKHNKSFKKSVKESLNEILEEPVAVAQIKEVLQPYSNSKNITISSIDIKQLSRNVEAAERIINMAMEMQREREDEEAILLLI